MTVVMTLRNPLKKTDLLPVFIEPNDTQLAKDWQSALKIDLQRSSQLEKNYCWHGWPNGARNLDYLTKELSRHATNINKFNELGIWQKSGLDDYKVLTFYSPETVMMPLTEERNSGGPNHDIMNLVHNYFENLQGTVENLSPYYKLASDNVKYSIRQLNLLCHEIETLCLSIRKQKHQPEWIRPSQITTFLTTKRYNLTDEHREGFLINGYDRKFAHVYMHWTQIGKTLMEVFRDEGAPHLDQATCDAITHLQYYSGEFDIEWGRDICYGKHDWHTKEIDKFNNWLIRENFDPLDKKLSLGYLELGKINLLKSFNTDNVFEIWKIMSNYLDIYSLEVDGYVSIYDYSWSDDNHEEQQIKYLTPGYKSHV